MMPEFRRFIMASRTGRRRKSDGNRITKGTVATYQNCFRLLVLFSNASRIEWVVSTNPRLSQTEFRRRKQYWERFARLFSDFLFARGYFDNYVSNLFKVIRTFLHYLAERYGWMDDRFFYYRFARPEEIPVLTLSLAQFRFLLKDQAFEESLTHRQKAIKDIVVVGCSTTLRVSDLLRMRKKHLVQENDQHWLVMQSGKTKSVTRLLLPAYVMGIFSKYHLPNGRLLPSISIVNLNRQIKILGALAGWTQSAIRSRRRRGLAIVSLPGRKSRFCDLLTCHTMRRTGISLLLMAGMPEHLVRKVSGHKPGSREFYKYVNLDQQWQDMHTEKAYGLFLDEAKD